MKKNIKQSLKEGWNSIKNNPSFTLKEQLGFASGSFGNAMGQDMIGTFFTLYMTDFMGIEASMLLVLSLVAKIINIVGDPVAGALFDLPPKNGKSRVRPFLLLSPFPLSITSVLLFVVPASGMTVRLIWVFAFYFIYCLSDTFYDMSLLTTSARMTTNPSDRKNFYTLSSFASTLGTTLPGGVIPIFISMYKNNYQAQSNIYLIGAVLFGVVGLLTMIVPAFTLREKVHIRVQENPVKINIKALFTNRPLLILVLAQIADSIRQICYGALTYLYMHTLQAAWMSTVVGSVSVALSYIGILLLPFIGKKFCPRDIIAGGYFYTAAFYIIMLVVTLLMGFENLTSTFGLLLVGVCIALAGFPNGAMGASRKILLADSTDYMEYKSRKKFGVPARSEGMVFAINSMANRINGMWKDLLLPIGLTIIGYVSATVTADGHTIEAVQTPETLKGIFYLVTIPGIAGNLIPGLITLCDNFHGKRRERILNELAEMRLADEENNEGETNDTPVLPDDTDTPSEALA